MQQNCPLFRLQNYWTEKCIKFCSRDRKYCSNTLSGERLHFLFSFQFVNVTIKGRGINEISPEDIEVKFDDVKGCDEAKGELHTV